MLPPSLYVIGVLGIATVAAGGYATLEHSWRKTADLQTAIEKAANEVSKQTITNLNDWRDANQAVTMELANQLEVERKREDADRTAVTELGKSDKGVRDYLDTPIPDALKRLLNKNRGKPHDVPLPGKAAAGGHI